MATMNISLPDRLRDLVEAQVATGRYSNASDYIRDLLRRDEEHQAGRDRAMTELQRLIDEGIASGISELTTEEVFEHARARALQALEDRDGVSHYAGCR